MSLQYFKNGRWQYPGGLVAVHYVEKTDTFSAALASNANTAVTGLSIADVGLSDASNRLIITAWFGQAGNSQGRAQVGIGVSDGTNLLALGDAAGNRQVITAGMVTAGTTATYIVANPSMSIVHAPGVTTPQTYTVHAFNTAGSSQTIYINRSQVDANAATSQRSASALLIQEVRV